MSGNEASWDRIVRVIIGIVGLYLGLGGVLSGAVAIVAIVIGAVMLLTGLMGWCPIYAMLKFRTNEPPASA